MSDFPIIRICPRMDPGIRMYRNKDGRCGIYVIKRLPALSLFVCYCIIQDNLLFLIEIIRLYQSEF